jgi:3',5'-cyclic AMP phosphodiesterase CpdA
MDGSDAVDPDSGNKEGGDLKPDKNNPNVSFAPNGLDQNIPWYTVYGNHDGLAVGNFKIDFHNETPSTSRAPVLAWVATLLGLTKPEVHLDSLIPTADRSPAIILANGDYVNHKDMTLNYKLLKAGTIPPDDLRAFISRRQFMAAHLRSGTMPRGHGFSVENLKTGHAYYATRPKADVPIRLIVMDTVATEQSFGEFAFDGALYTDQFENFVKKEIEDAAKNKEYVILASHHSAGRLMNKDGMVGEIEFKRYLTSQPNILAHICGHTHRNAVELVEGKYPYTEYQTSSVIDYPQQFRVFEIFQTEDGKMRITWKMSSHYENTKTETALAAESYRRSFFDQPNGGRKQKLVAILKPEETADLLESAWGLSVDGVPILSNQERLGKLTDRESSVVIDRPPL